MTRGRCDSAKSSTYDSSSATTSPVFPAHENRTSGGGLTVAAPAWAIRAPARIGWADGLSARRWRISASAGWYACGAFFDLTPRAPMRMVVVKPRGVSNHQHTFTEAAGAGPSPAEGPRRRPTPGRSNLRDGATRTRRWRLPRGADGPRLYPCQCRGTKHQRRRFVKPGSEPLLLAVDSPRESAGTHGGSHQRVRDAAAIYRGAFNTAPSGTTPWST